MAGALGSKHDNEKQSYKIVTENGVNEVAQRVTNVDSNDQLIIKTDGTSTANTTYVGYAVPGSTTSAAVWRIMRVVVSTGNVTVLWADGDASQNNIWDNRTGLSYS